MKKVILFCLMTLIMWQVNAQKCAVLEFRGSASVSVADIDGISEMFMTYFHPSGYTMIERMQIDKVISEQNFQRSNITDNQAVQLGKILNASIVVVGKVSMLGGQYQVDVRAINVQSGHDVAFDGATFSGDFRTNVRNVATKLAGKVAITPGTIVPVQQTSSQQYVDLGLPSGTLWKSANEKGGFYTYNEAVSKFGSNLPSREQWEELKGMCTWTWTGKGYKVTGDNGNFITLPAAGCRGCVGDVNGVGSHGIYWSSTPNGSDKAWYLHFSSGDVIMNYNSRCYGLSVRLVQD